MLLSVFLLQTSQQDLFKADILIHLSSSSSTGETNDIKYGHIIFKFHS